MTDYVLAVNPTTDGTGTHDPSAAIFKDGRLIFGTEEERYTRQKHAVKTFPNKAIRACLDFCDLELPEVAKIRVSWKPRDKAKYEFRLALGLGGASIPRKVYQGVQSVKTYSVALDKIEDNFSELGTPVPPIETYNHHRCHAVSAFFPTGFDEAIIITVDGRGESDSTVVWKGDRNGLQRIRTYKLPNSLGGFYGTITEYLGYRINNGEGKVMGLAPYGSPNQEIREKLGELINTGVNYDVTDLVKGGIGPAVNRLEALFDRPRKTDPGKFSDWEKDLAYVAQKLLEEIVVEVVEKYCRDYSIGKVGLAGGVALNCKMNKSILESDVVNEIFIQPVAHDAGTVLGAGWLENDAIEIDEMTTAAWGDQFTTDKIRKTLEECKLDYSRPNHLERQIAERLADGELIGWFQGRLEMGPRALGNRSILADPRTTDSRDRVNKFVKHREEWRPFAPSMLEEAIEDYLINAESAPFMIKTFDVVEEKKDEIPAVLHPADGTTRPQTVRKDQNPIYYTLIREFEEITGVPVILNTSFNDRGEPIVNRPTEAIKDFFGMGLDVLVLEDVVVEKSA